MNVRKGERRSRRTKTTRVSGRDPGIDLSDIAPLEKAFFEQAVRNPFYRPVKQSTTVRLDADVLAWLRSQGPGYQTRLNAILRRAMLRDPTVNRR
jgi:uncharacterized protein (DUF4415 family)